MKANASINISRYSEKPRPLAASFLILVMLSLLGRLVMEYNTMSSMNLLISLVVTVLYAFWAFSYFRGKRLVFEANEKAIHFQKSDYAFDIPLNRLQRVDMAPNSIRLMHHDCHHHLIQRSWFNRQEWESITEHLRPFTTASGVGSAA